MPWISRKELDKLRVDKALEMIKAAGTPEADVALAGLERSLMVVLPQELQPIYRLRAKGGYWDWSKLHAAAEAVRHAEKSQESADLVKIVNRMKGVK